MTLSSLFQACNSDKMDKVDGTLVTRSEKTYKLSRCGGTATHKLSVVLPSHEHQPCQVQQTYEVRLHASCDRVTRVRLATPSSNQSPPLPLTFLDAKGRRLLAGKAVKFGGIDDNLLDLQFTMTLMGSSSIKSPIELSLEFSNPGWTKSTLVYVPCKLKATLKQEDVTESSHLDGL